MGRSPCCLKEGMNRGAWTVLEDTILIDYIKTHGKVGWTNLPIKAGLKRCGKSCRLRWLNYLRPDIIRGNISPDEEDLIIRLHKLLGNRWSLIAGRIPGRTDNEIKNYWNTNLLKKVENRNGYSNGKRKSFTNLSMVEACDNLVPVKVDQNISSYNQETKVEGHVPMLRNSSFNDLVGYGNSTIDTHDDLLSGDFTDDITMGNFQLSDLLNFEYSGFCDVNNTENGNVDGSNNNSNNNGSPPMPLPSSDHLARLVLSNELLDDWSLFDQNVASNSVLLSSFLESQEDSLTDNVCD